MLIIFVVKIDTVLFLPSDFRGISQYILHGPQRTGFELLVDLFGLLLFI